MPQKMKVENREQEDQVMLDSGQFYEDKQVYEF